MSAPTDLPTAVQALAAQITAAITDPADGIRLLTQLANFYPASSAPLSPQGNAIASMQSAVGDICRRAALTALARASMAYQPSSYDDAASLRSTVCDLLDAEILVAGDQGQDATYAALRSLRTAVAQDLSARGATLAPIKTFTFGASLPASVLATRIYRDPTRSDQLVSQVDPIHPAFLPTTFEALAE